MYQPALPLGGIAGWRFLERTEAVQRAAFDRSAEMSRDVAHFRDKIFTVTTAEELVADRRLLKVALGAFGLEAEIGKTAFLRRILAEGSENPDALANRFVDPRYRDLARAFGFGDAGGARTMELGFAGRITDLYRTRQFEVAVGTQDPDLRLALGFRREIAALAAGPENATTKWYRVLGSTPLRTVLESAYGLPSEFATLDIDRQVEVMRDKTRALTGQEGVEAFADSAQVEATLNRFLVRREAETGPGPGTPGMAALTILRGGGTAGMTNLILSGLR